MIHTVLFFFFISQDYCNDVESQNDVFNAMYEFGLQTLQKYPPSTKFNEHLSNRFKEWKEFVDALGMYMYIILHTCIFNQICGFLVFLISTNNASLLLHYELFNRR